MPTGRDLEPPPNGLEHYPEAPQYPTPNSFALSNEAEQDVFGAYRAVLEKVRFFAGEDENLPGCGR
jgi:hypothetical protein